jgi:hypothetical protein
MKGQYYNVEEAMCNWIRLAQDKGQSKMTYLFEHVQEP